MEIKFPHYPLLFDCINTLNHYFLPVRLLLLAFIFILTTTLPAQQPFIHAESVGEWQIKERLSPEYHYNSIGVYLVNEQQLKSLFDPAQLSKEERKMTGIRMFDAVESLFFQLDLPNPQKEEDYLSFPLYTFDLTPSSQFKATRSHGKILDRISDEDLNGRGLEAIARIEMVSKNQLLEVAYKISSNINKLLGNSIFEKPDIWTVMQKAQNFFESRYKGKMVAEFSIPILPEREDYEYIIESASLYQIKWNFQKKVNSYKGNVWSDLKQAAITTENSLLDRPSRLTKLKKHPFLLVVRYKSAYALPIQQRINVSFTSDYLEQRRSNLLEFKRESIQYKAEVVFTELLRQTLDLQQNINNYLSSKAKGKINDQLLLSIAAQHHAILSQHYDYISQLTEEEAAYFKQYYETTYFKFFNKLENLLLQDPQIKDISQVPTLLLDWRQQATDSLPAKKLYQYLETLQPHRDFLLTTDFEGAFPAIVQREIQAIEQTLFSTLMTELPYTQSEKLEQFQLLAQQYSYCLHCKEQVAQQQAALSDRIAKELRTSLQGLQSQQLKYVRCFAALEKKATFELEKQFPDSTSLEESEQKLYHAFKDKIASLTALSAKFMTISKLDISGLSGEEVAQSLKNFKGNINQYEQHVCNLLYGGILSKEAVQCLTDSCDIEMP